MNNFLERNSSGLGGPKPKGWSPNSSTARKSPGSGGAPAALPSGGGLPVFEKRVQLKEGLPNVARGDPTREKAANPFLQERALGEPILGARTSSPSGRMHPNPVRRAELRKADMFHNIDYYGGIGAPDNDRLVKEASWLSTQSWFESLRYYPKGEDADDDEAAYSGLTHGMAAPTEHLETDVRTRLGIAKADADWVPDQLQMQWLPESPGLLKRLKKSYLNLRR